MKKLLLVCAMALFGVATMYADSPAGYPGGEEAMNEYISSNMIYPKTAADNGIEGIVTLSFTVNPDGSIGTIKVVRMIDPDLEQEAIRLVKNMPTWTPEIKGDKPVASDQKVSITFTLPTE